MHLYSNKYLTKRRLYLIIFFIFLWIFLFIPDKSYGQFVTQDTTEYRFWYSGFDARSTAMADANVADPFNLNGLYANPATLVFSTASSPVINNSLFNPSRGIILENLTASLKSTSSYRLVGGLTIQSSALKSDPLLNPGQLKLSQVDMTLGYAWMIHPSLSAGLRLNSMYGQTSESNVWTYNGSLGFLYAPSSSVSYGIVYKGSGIHEGWIGAEPFYQLNEENKTIVYSVSAPHRLELGVTLRFPSLAAYPDIVLSFSNEKIFGVDGLIYKGGTEIKIQDYMVLRGGYFFSPFAEGGRFGLGFLFDAFKLDYAYAPTNIDITGRSHQVSITFNL